jgi:hypothetical protein
MLTTTTFPIWQNQPFRLDEEEMEDPRQVLETFIQSRTLPEHRQVLWELLSMALAGNPAECLTGKEAGELVFYCRELEELIEAVFVFMKDLKVLNSI